MRTSRILAASTLLGAFPADLDLARGATSRNGELLVIQGTGSDTQLWLVDYDDPDGPGSGALGDLPPGLGGPAGLTNVTTLNAPMGAAITARVRFIQFPLSRLLKVHSSPFRGSLSEARLNTSIASTMQPKEQQL